MARVCVTPATRVTPANVQPVTTCVWGRTDACAAAQAFANAGAASVTASTAANFVRISW